MKKLTPCFVLYALITFHIVNTRMLKINECGIYDAEFSIRKKNHRFDNNITKITNNVNLQECMTGCTIHPHCFSINFNQERKICEFVNNTTIELTTNVGSLVEAKNWTFFDTKKKKAVSFELFPFLFIYYCISNFYREAYPRLIALSNGEQAIAAFQLFKLGRAFIFPFY